MIISLKNNRLVKILIKKKTLIKPTKIDVNELNELNIKKETGINKELFEDYFEFERPTELLKTLYNLNDKKKNDRMVNRKIKII